MSQNERGPSDVITDKLMKEALVRSGYLLEHRLAQVLTKAKSRYLVEASPMFPDRYSGKLREIDLQARCVHLLSRHGDGMLWPIPLLECVNNPQPLGFITTPAGDSPLTIYDVKLAGIPTKVIAGDRWKGMERENYGFVLDLVRKKKWHHFMTGRHATQYFSFQQKKENKQWFASHDNEHHDIFGKLVDAIEYLTNYLYGSYTTRGQEFVNIELFYPIVVVAGRLVDVRLDSTGIVIHDAEHIMYHRASIQDGESKTTIIDVITEAFFPQFLGNGRRRGQMPCESDQQEHRVGQPLIGCARIGVFQKAGQIGRWGPSRFRVLRIEHPAFENPI
jgi:hypothetical protein